MSKEARIRIVPGGPMLVRGLDVTRLARTPEQPDGSSRWGTEPVARAGELAICRCGRSAKMPWCDREAPYGCFTESPTEGPDPAPYRWDVPDPAEPGLALKPDGPVRVAGNVPIEHGDKLQPSRDRVSLCRCGHSRHQPLCDSSHKVAGYRADP